MNSQFDPPSTTHNLSFRIPPEVLVSLASGPLLLALLGGKAVTQLLAEISQQSEELFRGDRLPLLSFPSSPESGKS